MSVAWAGQMEQRTDSIKKAYSNARAIPKVKKEIVSSVKKEECEVCQVCEVRKVDERLAEIKVDGIDRAYVWFRTFIPSWLMGIIFLAGLCVMIPIMLKKVFGIELKINVNKKKKEAPDA